MCHVRTGPTDSPQFVANSRASDDPQKRTLRVPVAIPQGVTPESCTAACQTAGGFARAGLEVGRECC